MNCCCNSTSVFENSLHYASPAHGGWGVLKTAQLIPESYHLFVNPAACGRHGALGARMEGRKERVSYLQLTEQSIVSGDYEQLLINGVDEVIRYLEKRNRRPKVFSVFVSCIDDLLGTDHEAILEDLHAKHTGIKFIVCHMNPTSTDTNVPPAVNVQNKIYSVLEPVNEHDSGVNLVGILEDIRRDSELFAVLKDMGAEEVRHISHYTEYDRFQDMAKSRLNIIITPPGKFASKNMEKKLGIPFKMALTSFRTENIRKTYNSLAEIMNANCPDLDEYEKKAIQAYEETAHYLNGMPVIVDGEAIVRPFEFTRALIENGIKVERIYEQKLIPSDKEDFEWIRENHPEIPIIQSLNAKVSAFDRVDKECIAIGYSAGYLSGAEHVVNIGGQHGLYGYQGIVTLMEMIRAASKEKADLKKIIEDMVLVI